ncbi:hypothetical protein, partial [Bacillus anthracis]|uniref:hypothetical protein n=1 Tax=Bacillus anthracis TaxID=1392 RepID=UPI001E3C9B96
ENLFFLTYSLQITYVQNSFYNKIEGASVPESSKYFPINIFIKKKNRGFSLLCFFFRFGEQLILKLMGTYGDPYYEK